MNRIVRTFVACLAAALLIPTAVSAANGSEANGGSFFTAAQIEKLRGFDNFRDMAAYLVVNQRNGTLYKPNTLA